VNKKKVVLAENSRLFADSLSIAIKGETNFEIASEAITGVDAIKVALRTIPDIVVVGQMLPDINILQIINELQRNLKNTQILLLVYKEMPELIDFLGKNMQVSVIDENAGVGEFIQALRSMSKGERYISVSGIDKLKDIRSDKKSDDILAQLTQREREVLYWLANGSTNKEIAKTMILSELTVKNHVSHLLHKLNVDDRTKAAAIAWREGLPLIPEDFFLNLSNNA
jgi:DNA-binding NarL/FixJ family response regulator